MDSNESRGRSADAKTRRRERLFALIGGPKVRFSDEQESLFKNIQPEEASGWEGPSTAGSSKESASVNPVTGRKELTLKFADEDDPDAPPTLGRTYYWDDEILLKCSRASNPDWDLYLSICEADATRPRLEHAATVTPMIQPPRTEIKIQETLMDYAAGERTRIRQVAPLPSEYEGRSELEALSLSEKRDDEGNEVLPDENARPIMPKSGLSESVGIWNMQEPFQKLAISQTSRARPGISGLTAAAE